MKTAARLAGATILAGAVLGAAGLAPASAPARAAAAPIQDPFVAALTGEWAGTLEYANFSDDTRAEIDVRATIEAVPEPGAVAMRLIFVEPNGEEMEDRQVVRLDREQRTYQVGDEEFAVSLLDGFDAGTDGVLIWAGEVRENRVMEPFQQTLTVSGDELTILKETREPLRFRNVFRLRRLR